MQITCMIHHPEFSFEKYVCIINLFIWMKKLWYKMEVTSFSYEQVLIQSSTFHGGQQLQQESTFISSSKLFNYVTDQLFNNTHTTVIVKIFKPTYCI